MERHRGSEKNNPLKLATGPDAAKDELQIDAFARPPKIKRSSIRLPRPSKENPKPGAQQ